MHYPVPRGWPLRWRPARCACGAARFDGCPDAIADAQCGVGAPRGGAYPGLLVERTRDGERATRTGYRWVSSVDLIPGMDAVVEVDGGPHELPFLTVHGGGMTVLVCVGDDGPTDADLVFANALAEQAGVWRDRLFRWRLDEGVPDDHHVHP